ncbi:hypothetical protein D0B32_31665 [Paraburkholderia sp. DHOC27]|nr:hypothetical protein D0B32_31665 [Paraburkholderia sp. DHOC27]
MCIRGLSAVSALFDLPRYRTPARNECLALRLNLPRTARGHAVHADDDQGFPVPGGVAAGARLTFAMTPCPRFPRPFIIGAEVSYV